MEGKQTIAQLAALHNCSPSTIKRCLKNLNIEWLQPEIHGSGIIHLDATYFGRNCGVIVALNSSDGAILYMQHIAHERIADYENAINDIEKRGYKIEGIVIDGQQSLFKRFAAYKVQMCQFHLIALVRRKLTRNPQLQAGVELLELVYKIKKISYKSFKSQFYAWKNKWNAFLKERTTNSTTGKSVFTHQRLRSAMLSIEFYLPRHFTFEEVMQMPNTNNRIEGVFTDLKKKLSVHSGMSIENRKRFVNGFFLAYAKSHNRGGD